MTLFEIIILIIIYMFCYGYMFATFVADDRTSIGFKLFMVIACLVLAFTVPVSFGGMMFEKLNK